MTPLVAAPALPFEPPHEYPGVRVSRLAGLRIAKLRSIGLAPPIEAGGDIVVLELGPGEWMAMGAIEAAGWRTLAKVHEALLFEDVGAGLVVWVIEGPGAVTLLGRGCALEFAHVAEGRAIRTRFAGEAATIRRTGPSQFQLVVDRPLARYFALWLDRAARSL